MGSDRESGVFIEVISKIGEEDYGLRRAILSFTGIHRLQGRCGEAFADDLSERVSDDKRMEEKYGQISFGFSE